MEGREGGKEEGGKRKQKDLFSETIKRVEMNWRAFKQMGRHSMLTDWKV